MKVFRNKKNKIFQLFSNPVDPYLSGSVFSRLVQWCTPFYEKMDPARDYTVKSTRNWSSFQLFSTPSSCTFPEASFRVHCTFPEASFRVQFDGAHRFSIKRTQLATTL
ncbi:Protein RAFTIN 1A [Frankliniella fusca]|uniref:Protein RAFTIN 1A n=1 Tax=Frankliniella fusca TaxID=407009 RepID=A0AAE1HQ89_9NEOP|nr:Protein RAFTIN 1A [Frankliniella fusca]